MKAEVYERTFLSIGAALLVGCGLVLVYTNLVMGIHLPGDAGQVDPATVESVPPFDSPGVHQVGDNEYEVVILGIAWKWEPREVRVPAGANVTFIATSVDVIHGLHVEGTRLNMMLIPGQISRNSVTFREPGEHLIICHEYCGINHHTMFGKVIVE
jgi:cytochrome c oxidase subunit 2